MAVKPSAHPDYPHRSQRGNWLRAGVLGMNDGVVSVASLMLGVASADASSATILTAGIAGLAAGALSMAAGEYVSVSSQRDAEKADIRIESKSLTENAQAELEELAAIYVDRGLTPDLAMQVAQQLQDRDAVRAHLRDEIGIDDAALANPIQAAAASAAAFTVGAAVPIVTALILPSSDWAIVIASLITLAISGAVSADLGGGNRLWASFRVAMGGGIAMAITAFIGHLIGRSV